MYQEFYGFSEKPFNITPNPRFIFLSKIHREVFAHLLYGIRQRCGFIELTGEVGTGKTTVLRTLFNQLEQDDYRLAFIFNPALSALDLLRSINREFGIPVEKEATGADLLHGLNTFLLRENAEGRTVVLVIDEAQNLEPSVLEQIRLLSNLETETTKLIQIVLVGQPELGEVLSRTELRQLSQRITVRFHLRPMDAEDTEAYIRHRLRVAGGDRVCFTPAAVRRVFRHSKGLPRLINVYCDRALLVGYTEDALEITVEHVATAVRELRRENAAPLRLLRPFLLWLLPLLLAAGILFWQYARREMAKSPAPADAVSASRGATVENRPDTRGTSVAAGDYR